MHAHLNILYVRPLFLVLFFHADETAMLTEVPPEEYAAILDDVAAHTLIEAGIEEPPVDPFLLADIQGITVAEDATQLGRGRYVRLGGRRGYRPRPAVLLRPEDRPERSHWALAHEIGEHLAHRVFAQLNVSPRETPDNARESVANQLAGRLLVPTSWFLEDGTSFRWDLPRLKVRYITASHELLARRMLELPPPVIVTIIDKGQIYLRHSNIPGRVPPMAEVERECQRRANQKGCLAEGDEPPVRVQAWPVHEPGWKREILRTEVEVW